MFKKKNTLYFIAVVLMLEAVLVLVLPSRLPKPARALTAAINAIAAAAVWLLSRQARS